MCWSIDKKKFDKNPEKYHRVADKDIFVYKFGYVINGKFFPFFQDSFGYKPNVLNKEIKIVLTRIGKVCYYIQEGYHSYVNEKEAFHYLCFYKGRCELNSLINCNISNICIKKFIIPKGSVYYENEDNEIVSSQLVWTGEINMEN